MSADLLAKSGEAVKAGPIGLTVILLLCIVCYFLFKSMSKHMRNVRENFPGEGSGELPREPADPRELPSESAAAAPSAPAPGTTEDPPA